MRRIWNTVLKGLVAILPIGLTLYIVYWLAVAAERVFSPLIRLLLPEEYYWPGLGLVARGVLVGWLVLAVWTGLGVLLAVLFRGTALAVGIGILYALVVEGLLSALASQVGALDRLVELFLRANAYSLAATVGVSREEVSDAGPGSFSGPFVEGAQALLVLGIYGSIFVLVAGWLLHRRDVA